MYGYAGQYNAQRLKTWTEEWGGGTLPKSQHGSGKITPGNGNLPLMLEMNPGGPWDTYYVLQRMPAQNLATEVVYHVAYQFGSDVELALCQALEFEIQRNDGHQILNGGVQFDLKGSGKVRTYDFIAGHWVATPIACDPAWLKGGAVLDVVCVYDLAVGAITWRGLQINGTWHPLDITRPSKRQSQTPYLNFAWQYDCTGVAETNTLFVPGIDITVT
jgi:hypothetical protein